MRWIVTDDIYAETWRQLLEFSNLDLAADVIARRNSQLIAQRNSGNIKKQAIQARVCVLQAKEYFDAARSASLFTSPNHSYYGAIALASLMLLILGDGTKSLDYLRKDIRNNHHGLSFTTGCDAKSAAVELSLIENSRVEILEHGHFPNLYKTLPQVRNVSAIIKRSYGSTSTTGMQVIGSYSAPTFDSFAGKKKTLLELLRYLPDLDSDLQRHGISTTRSRTTHEVVYGADNLITHTWRIHGCDSAAELESFLEGFSVSPGLADALNFEGPENGTTGIVTLKFKAHYGAGILWPTSRDTMNHDAISYAGMQDTHEIIDLYLVAYQLSMLSRYFPDIWVRCIESQCRAAKLIERASEIILKKLPILSLSMLHSEETVISTHREPWK